MVSRGEGMAPNGSAGRPKGQYPSSRDLSFARHRTLLYFPSRGGDIMRIMRGIAAALTAALAGVTAVCVAPSIGNARTLKTIYNFCAKTNCADGQYPGAALLIDGAGRMYGTTGTGGAHNEGVVFQMRLNPASGRASIDVLHDFCAMNGSIDCEDGKNPYTTLVRDKLGNLFGVTTRGGVFCAPSFGGLNGCGTVFGLFYNKTNKTYRHRILHVFCTDGAGCADGSFPTGGLVMGKDGNLYGVTSGGRTNGDYGTVFKMTPKDETHTRWAFKVLHKFCNNGTCADGTSPSGGLTIDSAGNLYGTAYSDGPHDGGVAFALMLNNTTGKYAYKVLYNFCSQTDCTDGSGPLVTLALDDADTLYGMTLSGGTHSNGGTVFRLTPNANKTAWAYKVIYNFCTLADCADGNGPYTNLVVDQAG
ncbi:MAG: hypothetical protein IT162_15710, partial [Bryobacterales bacterium]|nr:hypothetical protein [Bryobacterales bacterium]